MMESVIYDLLRQQQAASEQMLRIGDEILAYAAGDGSADNLLSLLSDRAHAFEKLNEARIPYDMTLASLREADVSELVKILASQVYELVHAALQQNSALQTAVQSACVDIQTKIGQVQQSMRLESKYHPQQPLHPNTHVVNESR